MTLLAVAIALAALLIVSGVLAMHITAVSSRDVGKVYRLFNLGFYVFLAGNVLVVLTGGIVVLRAMVLHGA